MEANEIRKIVNEVNPPIRGKPMSLTKELSSEISNTVPFWAALLRKRDIRDAEGGDEFITGLIETFSRIYTALKAKGAQGILTPIDLDTLYNLDTELSKSDMSLPDEYPALEMVDIKGQGSFGAGTLMAYALFETALAVLSGPGATDTGTAHTPAPQTKEPIQSLVDDLLAGLPEETSSPTPTENTGPMGKTPVSPPSSKTEEKPSFLDWNFDPQSVRPAATPPAMVLEIYITTEGIKVRGKLPPTLHGAAQAYNIVSTIFKTDANIVMGPGGPEFTFTYAQEGGQS